MLKILCCVKQVPDVNQMRLDPETGNLIRAGVPMLLNPVDANALAAAMWVKEEYGGELTLISMGPPSAEEVLRECYAVGADKAILVTDRAFGSADTLATSYTITAAAKTVDDYDLIFCAKESLDGATGQLGVQIAERLEAAQVSGAVLIRKVDAENRGLVVDREVEGGTETLEVRMPCVLIMEKTNYPARIAKLHGKIAAQRADVLTITANDIPDLDRSKIGDPGSPTKTARTFTPEEPEPGIIIDEGSVRANAAKLLTLICG